MTGKTNLPEASLPAPARGGATPAPLYKHVGDQLGALIPLFGLESASDTIARAYELLCSESLAIPCGRRPSRASRLNADGTPFQFSLALGASRTSLQFLTDPTPPRLSSAERLSAARQRVREAAALLGADSSLAQVSTWLDEMAPAGDVDLMANDAGAIWIGTGFEPNQEPKLKVYVNAKWGPEKVRWEQLAALAAHVGVAAGWQDIEGLVKDELEPLGISLAIVPDTPPAGRIYLSGYGKAFGSYEALADACGGDAFREHLRMYGKAMLQEDHGYPLRSVVCSFGLESGATPDFKFELCGHCAFESDVQARGRCAEWLHRIDVDPAPYLQMVDLLSGGMPCATEARLHAYLGTGSRNGDPYSTFYFNPAAGPV